MASTPPVGVVNSCMIVVYVIGEGLKKYVKKQSAARSGDRLPASLGDVDCRDVNSRKV